MRQILSQHYHIELHLAENIPQGVVLALAKMASGQYCPESILRTLHRFDLPTDHAFFQIADWHSLLHRPGNRTQINHLQDRAGMLTAELECGDEIEELVHQFLSWIIPYVDSRRHVLPLATRKLEFYGEMGMELEAGHYYIENGSLAYQCLTDHGFTITHNGESSWKHFAP